MASLVTSRRRSSTLLGRTKLQAVSTAPVKPTSPPRPPAVPKPPKPHHASVTDYL